MIIYNVTTNIHESVHQQWLIWMQHKHIPEMIATGKFSAAKMSRVLVEEEMGGTTYSVQFSTESATTLQQFYEQDKDILEEEGIRLFGDKMLCFATELEVISEY